MSSGDRSPSLRASPARKARAEGVRVRPGGDQQLRRAERGALRRAEALLQAPAQPRGLDSQWTHQQQKG